MTPPDPRGLSAGAPRLRRFGVLGLAWTAATVTATTITWFGVGLVTSEVTEQHPALSPARIAELAAAPAEAEAMAEAVSPVAPPTSVEPSPTSTEPPAPTTSAPRPKPAPPTTATPAPTTSAPRWRTTTTTTAPTRTDAASTGAGTDTVTFDIPGGVVSVRCFDDGIRLVSARPQDGTRLVVRDDGPYRVVVDVWSGYRSSETWVFRCDDGRAMRFRVDDDRYRRP